MKRPARHGTSAVLLSLLLLVACGTGPESSVPPPPSEPVVTKEVEKATSDFASSTPESKESATPPPKSAAELLPEGLTLVTESGAPARRLGDFDGDGGEDAAYLAVRELPSTIRELNSEKRLFEGSAGSTGELRLLILLATGEDLLLKTAEVTLLAEFTTLPLTRGGKESGSSARPQKEDLVYLRFENREGQRHLLFAIHPEFKTPHRYLFLTDSATEFLVRDVDEDGVSEVVHVETVVTAGGMEESYFSLYQFSDRALRRQSRMAVVERTNALLEKLRRHLLAGEVELLRERLLSESDRSLDDYFKAIDGTPLSKLGEVEFLFVPKVGTNPFDLTKPKAELRTEILVVVDGTERLFEIRIGFLVEPETGPTLELLPISN